MFEYVPMCGYVYMSLGAIKGQKSYAQELGFQVAHVCQLMWVLGTKIQSSAKGTTILNYRTIISRALVFFSTCKISIIKKYEMS